MDGKEIKFIDLFGGIGGFRYGLEQANMVAIDRTKNGRSEENTEATPETGEGLVSTQGKTDSATAGRTGDSTDQQSIKGTTAFRCVWYCDNNKYAVAIYNKRFNERWKPTDIHTVNTENIPDFDMLCAGFPCQSFSIAGRRKGFQDIRGTLFHEICRIAKTKRPRLLLLENVKGLLSIDNGRCFGTIISSLDELGYDVTWQILNSKRFGVPQNRERVFIVGYLRNGCRKEILPL